MNPTQHAYPSPTRDHKVFVASCDHFADGVRFGEQAHGHEENLDVINRMDADGAIGRYAIAGAVAAYNYVEPALTDDLDIMIAFESSQAQPRSALKLGSVLSYSVDLEVNPAEGIVKTRVLRPEYIVATALRVNRAKDRNRIIQFLDDEAVDIAPFAMYSHDTVSPMLGAPFAAELASRTPARQSQPHEASVYPDISDILRAKAERRRDIARRSFGEKIAMMEALRERVAPFKRARERRRAAKRVHPSDDAS